MAGYHWLEQLIEGLSKVKPGELIVVTGIDPKQKVVTLQHVEDTLPDYLVIDNIIECDSFISATEMINKSDKKSFILDATMFGKFGPDYAQIYQTSNLCREKALNLIMFSDDPSVKTTRSYMRVFSATLGGLVLV